MKLGLCVVMSASSSPKLKLGKMSNNVERNSAAATCRRNAWRSHDPNRFTRHNFQDGILGAAVWFSATAIYEATVVVGLCWVRVPSVAKDQCSGQCGLDAPHP